MKDMPYSDWFGNGNTKDDVEEVVAQHGTPLKVFSSGYMAAVVYEDKVVCVGYDGNEYCHSFLLDHLED